MSPRRRSPWAPPAGSGTTSVAAAPPARARGDCLVSSGLCVCRTSGAPSAPAVPRRTSPRRPHEVLRALHARLRRLPPPAFRGRRQQLHGGDRRVDVPAGRRRRRLGGRQGGRGGPQAHGGRPERRAGRAAPDGPGARLKGAHHCLSEYCQQRCASRLSAHGCAASDGSAFLLLRSAFAKDAKRPRRAPANAGPETRARSKLLSEEIGASHLQVGIDPVVSALTALFVAVTGKAPRFKLDGGSAAENLALQNIQARLRMVVAFLLAQLLPWTRGRRAPPPSNPPPN